MRKTTLVDFPPLLAAAVFLHGCNLRCPYCYNSELVTGTIVTSSEKKAGYEAVTAADVIAHLEKRKNVLAGFVISGGEALLQLTVVETLIRAARELGYKIKLDTNGMLPERLEALIGNRELCPDFIALDVKTSPKKYAQLLPDSLNRSETSEPEKSIEKSIKLLARLPKDRCEFRTVLVPRLVTHEDIAEIAALLPKNASWRFARFQNGACLDPRYSETAPYTEAETAALIKTASALITDAVLR